MSNEQEEEFSWLEIDLSDIVFLVRRHILLLIVAPLIGLVAAVAVAKQLPPVYATEALLYIRPNFDQDLRVAHADTRLDDDDSLRSIAEALTSHSVILRMIDRLDLRSDQNYLPAVKKGKPLSDLQLVKAVRERYRTKLRPTTRLIELHVEDYDPDRAMAICQTLSEEFLSYMREDRIAKEKDVREMLVKQADITLEHALASEEKLKNFRMEHSDTLVEQDSNVFHERILEQSTASNLANSELLRLEGLLAALEDIDAEVDAQRVFQVLEQKENKYISDLLILQANARSELAEAKGKYTPTHPQYQGAISRLADVEKSVRLYAVELKEGVKSEYQASAQKAMSLERQLEGLKAKFIGHKTESASFRGIKEEIDRNWNTHTQLQQRIMDLDLDPDVLPTFVTTVESPLRPDKKAKPRNILWAAAGLVMGCLAALFVILWKNRKGLPFTSVKQSEKILDNTRVVSEISSSSWSDESQGIFGPEGVSSIREMVVATREAKIVHMTGAYKSQAAAMVSHSYADLNCRNGLKTLLITLGDGTPQGNIVTSPSGYSTLNLSPDIVLDFAAFNSGVEKLLGQFQRLVIDTNLIPDREAKLAISELSSSTIIAVEGGGVRPRSGYRSLVESINLRTSSAFVIYYGLPGKSTRKRSGAVPKPVESHGLFRRITQLANT